MKPHKRYKIFHDRAPDWEQRVEVRWDNVYKYMGEAIRIDYMSDKWNPGEDVAYYHYFEHIDKHPVHAFGKGGHGEPLEPSPGSRKLSSLVYLGKLLGFWYDDKQGDLVRFKFSSKAVLCTDERGKALYILDSGKVPCVIEGGKLNVESRGITG